LDAFDLTEEIGSGASGRVWSAVHRDSGDLGPQIAVKILSGSLAQNDRWVAAFRREIQAIATLDHPNIVRVFDHGRVPAPSPFPSDTTIEANSPYLAMEYLGGGTLTSRAGRLHWADLQAVLLTMLDALAHAHARGVLHRDIKPSNLMLGPSGVTITDFGIGFTLSEDNPGADRMVGTPAYMAPEQFQCKWRDYGPWTDLYSLGCTGYALACARPPFGAGQSLEDSMQGHLFKDVPGLDAKMEIPDGFEAWLRRLMRKSPRNRFQCAADAAWALSSLKLPKGSAEALRPPSAELSALGFSTLDLPSEVPTDLLSSYTFAAQELGALKEDDEARPNFAPPCPDHWRRSQQGVGQRQLEGVGLGLYGLRSIPLVDREAERTELWSGLREVHRRGEPQIRVLRGAGGNGKSRLAQWLCERASETGAARTLRAVHSATPGPGDGLAAMFSRRLGCANLTRAEATERLRTLWHQGFKLSLEETQGLADYLHSGTNEKRTVGFDGVRFQSPAERNAVLERLIRHETRDRPLVLWLDDVHHGLDSLFFVLHLLAGQGESPLRCLIVLTVRDDLLVDRATEGTLLKQILDLDEVREIPVGPLDAADRPALVQELLGLQGELAQRVEERSGGNPLFAIQLVGDWVQRGILLGSPSGFEVRPGASLQIPDTIHDIWTERVGRLLREHPHADATTLELAATLGQQVDWGEWRLACKQLGTVASMDLVDELIELGLAALPLRGGSERGWSFVHGLLRESLKRQALEGGRAQDQHRACAHILKDRFGPDVGARYAHHLMAAGELETAVDALGRCAEGFIESGELRRAEEMLTERDSAMDRLGFAPEAEQRIDSLLLRSFVARAEKAFPKSLEIAAQAEALSRVLGSTSRIARSIRARATPLGEMGQLEESERAQHEAARLAEEAGDLRCLAAAKRGRGAVLTVLGDQEAARKDLEHALELYRGLGDGYGIAVCLIGLCRNALFLEDYGQVRDLADQAAAAAQRLGFRALLVDSVNQQGEAARGLGELEVAETHYREALRLARKLPTYAWIGTFEVNLGLLLARQERWEEALAFYRAGAESLRRSSGDVQAAMADLFALTCLAALGRWADCDSLCDPVLSTLRQLNALEPDLARSAFRTGQFAVDADRPHSARASVEFAAEQWAALGNHSRANDVRAFLESLEPT
jgi:serine/threonine protein kinase/tetratricopeptide (TPR) repeat protein